MLPAPAESLLLALRQIPDPRGRQGRRHSLSAMLAAVICAMLCGARSYSAIADWIHAQKQEVWHGLGFWRRPPQLGAFRKLSMKLSPQALQWSFLPSTLNPFCLGAHLKQASRYAATSPPTDCTKKSYLLPPLCME